MKKKKFGWTYRISRGFFSLFLPSYEIKQKENLNEPIVFVSHHQNMMGPIRVLVNHRKFVRTWALSTFFDQKECFDHYIDYTLTKRFGIPKILAKLGAWPFSFYVEKLMKSGHFIPVYRQSRKVVSTIKESIAALTAGEDILIFPDIDYSDSSEEIGAIYNGFLSLEKHYYRKTNKHLSFVPVYADEQTEELKIGKAIRFKGGSAFIDEREQVAMQLQEALNELTQSYPVDETGAFNEERDVAIPQETTTKAVEPMDIH